MPLHLPALSRRAFLLRIAGLAAGVTVLRHVDAAEAGDPNVFALISDSHIDADPAKMARDVNMSENLTRVLRQIIARRPAVSSVLLNGDVAITRGLAEDYAQLARLVQPLSAAGIPLHMTLGNHDDRDVFRKALAAGYASPLEGKHVTVIQTPRVNWFLLDTLDIVNKTPGQFGETQRMWLTKALDEFQDKPAIVFAHHNIQPDIEKADKKHGILDGEAFLQIIRPRRQVKAFVFGHSHNWQITEDSGIHLINLPPTAYVFDKTRPSGWVEAAVQDTSLTLTLHALSTDHPEHRQTKTLTWRT